MIAAFIGGAGFGATIILLLARSTFQRLQQDHEDDKANALREQYNTKVFPLLLKDWEREDRYPGRRAPPVRLPASPVRVSE